MNTQNPGSNKIPAIRTYANDLEYTRKTKTKTHSRESAIDVTERKEAEEHSKKTFPARKSEVEAKNHLQKNETPIKQIEKNDFVKLSNIDTKNTSFIASNEDAALATVITDTKKDRFNLFAAIYSSVSKWFISHKQIKKIKSTPRYNVPDISHRKGVIQKATSTTGKSVTSDFSQIHNRIKHRPEPTVKHELHTIWTPDTETGFLLLDEPEPTISNVQITPRKSIFNQVNIQDEVAETIAEEEATEILDNEVEIDTTEEDELGESTATQKITSLPIEPIPEKVVYVSDSRETENQIKKTDYTPDVEEPLNIELKKVDQAISATTNGQDVNEITTFTKIKNTIANLDTNTLALIVSSFILIVIIIIFIINQLATSTNGEAATVTTDPETISLLQNTKLNLIQVSDINKDIKLTLQNTETKNKIFEQIVFVENENTNKTVSAAKIFESLNISLEPNFAQNISDVSFGFAKNDQPFVILKIKDITSARGGMLMWEGTIYKDLINLFDLVQVQANDLTKFSDTSFSGKDVRIKKTEDDTELLLYGIINQTIIITTNNVAFRELSLLVK